MLKKYKIILLQNGLSKKTLFTSNVKRTTFHKFRKFLNSNKPLFYRKYVKRKFCQFELGIFSTEDNQNAVYRKDNVGRNIQVVDTVQNYHIMELSPYWVEELIYDHQNKSRVSFDYLIENLFTKKRL